MGDSLDDAIASIPAIFQAEIEGKTWTFKTLCKPGRCGTKIGNRTCGSIVSGGKFEVRSNDGIEFDGFSSYSASKDGIIESFASSLKGIGGSMGAIILRDLFEYISKSEIPSLRELRLHPDRIEVHFEKFIGSYTPIKFDGKTLSIKSSVPSEIQLADPRYIDKIISELKRLGTIHIKIEALLDKLKEKWPGYFFGPILVDAICINGYHDEFIQITDDGFIFGKNVSGDPNAGKRVVIDEQTFRSDWLEQIFEYVYPYAQKEVDKKREAIGKRQKEIDTGA